MYEMSVQLVWERKSRQGGGWWENEKVRNTKKDSAMIADEQKGYC